MPLDSWPESRSLLALLALEAHDGLCRYELLAWTRHAVAAAVVVRRAECRKMIR